MDNKDLGCVRATASPQPAGGLRPEPAAQSQPIGAHQAQEFDPARFTMRETAHLNGGKDWFGYKYQCVENPRLHRLDRYVRKDRSVQSTWRVDGEDCVSFEDAVDLLDRPPSLTLIELEMIARFVPGMMAKSEFGDFSDAYPVLRSLDNKGLVWWSEGRVRLLAGPALAAIGSTESNASGNSSYEAVAARVGPARLAAAQVIGGEA